MPESAGNASIVTVRRLDPGGMIMIRGDLADGRLDATLSEITGKGTPSTREINLSGDRASAWMSPDELLLFVPGASVRPTLEQLNEAMEGKHFLAVEVSSLRAMFEIEGLGARDVLAKGTPADVSPNALPVGLFCRSRLGQVQAAFWTIGEGVFRIVCRRSEAGYVEGWLESATTPGTIPGYYTG